MADFAMRHDETGRIEPLPPDGVIPAGYAAVQRVGGVWQVWSESGHAASLRTEAHNLRAAADLLDDIADEIDGVVSDE